MKRLNEARKLVTKKVDLLCNDLVTAYSELSSQLEGVRTQEGFRKYIGQAKDLEQLLCHAMDWILRQIGYCNVAIWLASEQDYYQLGAYMKYTIAGENDLIEAMKKGIVPQIVNEGAIHLSDEQMQQHLTPQELDYLADQTLMGVNCTYLGECLATVVIFRDGKQTFTDEDYAVLKAISPIFAGALASMVRSAPTDKYESDETPFYDGEGESSEGSEGFSTYDEDEKPKKNRKKPDSADWWKRGEPPPF